MLIMFLSGKTITASQISERFDISTRTVYRYIDELCLACVPIVVEHGPTGGFKLADTYKLPNLFFTESELRTLTTLLNSLKEQLNDSKEINSILEKLLVCGRDEKDINIRSSSLIIDGMGWTTDKTFSKKLSVMSSAIDNDRLLRISYRAASGEQTLRDIEPHALALKNGVWYVYAYCRLREDFRLFKISRIEYANVVGHFTKRKFDFKAKPMKEWFSNDVYVDVKLSVSPEVRADVEEWLGVDNVYTAGDKIYAEARLPYNKMLISEIMKFGEGIRVEKPVKLKNDVINCAKSIAALYKNN